MAKLPPSELTKVIECPLSHTFYSNNKTEVRHVIEISCEEYTTYDKRIATIFDLKRAFPFFHTKNWIIVEDVLGNISLTLDTFTEDEYYDVSHALLQIANFKNRNLQPLFSKYYPLRASKLHLLDDMQPSDVEEDSENSS